VNTGILRNAIFNLSLLACLQTNHVLKPNEVSSHIVEKTVITK